MISMGEIWAVQTMATSLMTALGILRDALTSSIQMTNIVH